MELLHLIRGHGMRDDLCNARSRHLHAQLLPSLLLSLLPILLRLASCASSVAVHIFVHELLTDGAGNVNRRERRCRLRLAILLMNLPVLRPLVEA